MYTTTKTSSTIVSFLAGVNSPVSEIVAAMYLSGQHDLLTQVEVNPHLYNNAFKFRDDYVAAKFLAKAEFLKTTFDRREVALKGFFAAEEQCQATNAFFLDYDRGLISHDHCVHWVLHSMRRSISRILGSFNAEEFVDGCDWGPGSTTLIKGDRVSELNKFRYENGITPNCRSFVKSWFPLAWPTWYRDLCTNAENRKSDSVFKLCEGSQIITVPKNSKTDRVIAVEPGINLWCQKGIGSMISRRLARAKVDLKDQTLNQTLAQRASIDGCDATVDMKAASDTISYQLVKQLLPDQWFSVMDSCRSRIGSLDDRNYLWSKFSSMGNGYTFELESLIFYTAAKAVCDRLGLSTFRVNVYGDDIIIPSEAFSLFSEVCQMLGFTVNTSKSFSTGHFRESCGSHFFKGLDCQPFYLKEELSDVPSIFKTVNGVRLLAHRYNNSVGCASRFRTTWSHLFGFLARKDRLLIPHGIGDVGVVDNFDSASPRVSSSFHPRTTKDGLPNVRYLKHGYEGFTVTTIQDVAVEKESYHSAMLLFRLNKRSLDNAAHNLYAPRGRSRLKRVAVSVQKWYNLGPWI